MAITTGYGLRPVQLLGGKAFSGGTIREFVVTPGNNTYAFGQGDLITIAAGVAKVVGAAAPAAGTLSTNTPVGVLVGLRYSDPVLKQTQHGQYLPADSTGYTNIFAKVVDDPEVLFQTRVDAAITYTAIGYNVNYVYSAANATTGVSKSYVTGAATTNTFPFRIVDVIGGDGSTYTDIIVKYNWQTHAYTFPTGQ